LLDGATIGDVNNERRGWCANLHRCTEHCVSPIDETYAHPYEGEAFGHRQTYAARSARDNR
jgi:hypothetical protein